MKKKLILGIIIAISFLSISINKLYSYINPSPNKGKIAIYVDDEIASSVPNKGDGYILDRYECSDDTKLKWNYDSWSVILKDFKAGTSCTYYFKKGHVVSVDNNLDEGTQKEEEKIDDDKIGVADGKKVKDLEIPTKEGYTFQGWYDQNGKELNGEDLITDDMQITAKWTINTYKLTIQVNDGTVNGYVEDQVINIRYKEQYELKTMVKKGYTFTNFEISNNKTTISNNVLTMGSSDTTIKALWTINTYKLKIVDSCNNTEETRNVRYNETVDITEPTCEGHTLTGFNLDKGTYENNKFTATDSDAVLTFNWTTNNYPYIVRHSKQNVNGEGYTLVDADTFTGEAKYHTQVTPDTKTYTGFTSPSKQTITIQVDDNTYKKNKVDYKYTRNKYNLTINTNGGTMSETVPGKLYYEQSATIENPTKTCHTFTNWTVNGGTIKDKVFTMGNTNATLTANYTINQNTITLNVNGGNSLPQNTYTIDCGTQVGNLPVPTRDNYIFKGWYTAKEGGQRVNEDSDITSNMVLYAQWQFKGYTIVFNINGGTGRTDRNSTDSDYTQMPNQQIPVGVTSDLDSNKYFKKTETATYKFKGWARTSDGEVVYTNQEPVSNLGGIGTVITLYAKYELIEENIEPGRVFDEQVNVVSCDFEFEDVGISPPRQYGKGVSINRPDDRIEEIVGTRTIVDGTDTYQTNFLALTVKVNWKENVVIFDYDIPDGLREQRCKGLPR